MSDKLPDSQMFAVDPKTNCNHVLNYTDKSEILGNDFTKNNHDKYLKEKCTNCDSVCENWICLVCS